MIIYVKGDLFEGIKKDIDAGNRVVIPHICNNMGTWGAGFVVPLGKNYIHAKLCYQAWALLRTHGDVKFELGNSQQLTMSDDVMVCNMIAQDNRDMMDRKRLVNYVSLAQCLSELASSLLRHDGADFFTRIHAPKFGAGIGGGDWNIIEKLIEDAFYGSNIPITVYEY